MRALDELVSQGFIEERTEQTSSNYEIHLYSLTTEGEEFLNDARAKRLVNENICRIITEIVQKYGRLPLPKLVQEAYSQF